MSRVDGLLNLNLSFPQHKIVSSIDTSIFLRYYFSVIKTFRNDDTAALMTGTPVRRIPQDVRRRAKMRLLQINAAAELGDLRIPPSNRLEKLTGDRKDQYSIRVNRQWRICFNWENGDAYDVEFCDYH